MKLLLTTNLIFVLGITISCAQINEQPAYNTLSFELGKTGFIYNLTYDHKFGDKDFGFRFGIGSNLAKYLNAFTIGCGVYYLFGKTSGFFELGGDLYYLKVDEISDDQKGGSFVYPDYSTKTYYAGVNIGYRKCGKRSLFRMGFSPGLIKEGFVPGGYFSIGVTF